MRKEQGFLIVNSEKTHYITTNKRPYRLRFKRKAATFIKQSALITSFIEAQEIAKDLTHQSLVYVAQPNDKQTRDALIASAEYRKKYN